MTTPPLPACCPEHAALADAHLTLRQDLQRLITLTQAAAQDRGMSLTALREEAERLIPLLDGPGRDWTDAYYRATHANAQAESLLREYRALRQRGKRHDFLIDDALNILEMST